MPVELTLRPGSPTYELYDLRPALASLSTRRRKMTFPDLLTIQNFSENNNNNNNKIINKKTIGVCSKL